MTVKLRPTIEYPLTTPVVITRKGPSGGEVEETIEKVVVRKPLAGDLRAVDHVDGENAKELAMLAHLSDLPQIAIDKLELDDLAELQARLQGFLPRGPKTGGTASES